MVGVDLGRGKMEMEEEEEEVRNYYIFTYGTLKKGFSNHSLMEDLIATGDAVFLGNYRTSLNYPLVCGPYRVPFLLKLPGSGHHRVLGELYSVSAAALSRLDFLEGTSKGHYQRLPISVENPNNNGGKRAAEAYFAHSSFAMELWNKDGRKGFPSYSKEVATGYVPRKDRPHHLTFLDHIHSFLHSSSY
ncbi:hypothetical protein L484_019657 [Morus notabilis]|uniref:Gamma-glutamylcyclotransferase family protein n=1 Tax=Morus notabilis TaxID=981085 RepID=W9QMY4_9ROSA|nr:putative gamma-glutamylcyclotransferase At3g02910 [Morus notabilis]EXB29134.1 hypothetical protein L484_019657 [Morus notabilis]